jgi:hypothetical protein
MVKKHQDGAKTGKQKEPGRRRGVETGNGWTASTGRGKPNHVTSKDPNAPAGVSRILGFLWTRKAK